MKTYDDWDKLVVAAQKRCSSILKDDVAPVAKEIVRKHIQSDIYDVYTPKPNGWINGSTYQRRYSLPKHMTGIVKDTLSYSEILITSTALPSKSIFAPGFKSSRPGAFLEMLEKGDMGFWRKNFPRPAVSNAQDEIDKSKEIERAIQKGLDREFSL